MTKMLLGQFGTENFTKLFNEIKKLRRYEKNFTFPLLPSLLSVLIPLPLSPPGR